MRKVILNSLLILFISQAALAQTKKPVTYKKKYQKQLKWTGKFTKNDKDMINSEPI
jgi:hypothetical protein